LKEYDDLARDRLANKKHLENLRSEIRGIETKISAIDQRAIEDLITQRDAYRADKSRKEGERQDAEIDRRRCEELVAELDKKWEGIKAANQKQRKIQNRITVSQDLTTTIGNTLNELQTVYLRQVSDRMNDLFLQMVGADPEVAGGVFRKAEITPEYEIKVLTADNRTLDPDHELNGASKRALTFAFIWSLTEVSGVVAPRVIDTPLGMMSGGVKRRVVEIIASLGTGPPPPAATGEQGKPRRELQVVLFLTRQEILKVEDLLDERAGKVITFTNTASYPADLVHDPGVERPSILVCACNHREKCPVCARKDDDQYELTPRVIPY
jgi:DNA sulfur modification protein DndD